MKKVITLLIFAIIIVLVAGCGETTVKTSGGTVSVQDNNVAAKNNDMNGNISGNEKCEMSGNGKCDFCCDNGKCDMCGMCCNEGEVKLPEGYPTDVVPIINDGKITAAMKNQDQNKKPIFQVTTVSDKGLKEVQDFYQKALQGATKTTSSETATGYFFIGTKGDKSYSISMYVKQSGGKQQTRIQIVIAPNS